VEHFHTVILGADQHVVLQTGQITVGGELRGKVLGGGRSRGDQEQGDEGAVPGWKMAEIGRMGELGGVGEGVLWGCL
jgi:hypothetical protein